MYLLKKKCVVSKLHWRFHSKHFRKLLAHSSLHPLNEKKKNSTHRAAGMRYCIVKLHYSNLTMSRSHHHKITIDLLFTDNHSLSDSDRGSWTAKRILPEPNVLRVYWCRDSCLASLYLFTGCDLRGNISYVLRINAQQQKMQTRSWTETSSFLIWTYLKCLLKKCHSM